MCVFRSLWFLFTVRLITRFGFFFPVISWSRLWDLVVFLLFFPSNFSLDLVFQLYPALSLLQIYICTWRQGRSYIMQKANIFMFASKPEVRNLSVMFKIFPPEILAAAASLSGWQLRPGLKPQDFLWNRLSTTLYALSIKSLVILPVRECTLSLSWIIFTDCFSIYFVTEKTIIASPGVS
jgi:hypothetical protein